MHITFLCDIFIQSVDFLYFRKRSKRNNVTDLRLSALEHCGTVYSRDQIHFCGQRADFIDRTSIRAFVIL